jgi:hypothetical protein
MPLPNRVDPWGTIFRTNARGTFMGNRGGQIHNTRREIVRPYASRRWITCLLEFKGRHRTVMSPRHYTELFFLDEAVAFAAGHRPCAECRRDRFKAFQDAWMRSGHPACDADSIDKVLHESRLDARKQKLTFQAALNSLPQGCFVQIESAAYLVWDGALLLWSPEGYLRKRTRPTGSPVTVLSPKPVLGCFRHGYKPEIHASAFAKLPAVRGRSTGTASN